MKIFGPIILILILCNQISGQTANLNSLYDRDLGNSTASLAIGDSSYFIASREQSDHSLYHYSKINFQGDLTDTLNLRLNDSTIGINSNCKNCLHVHNGRLYNSYTEYQKTTGFNTSSIILSKIHLDLSDTIETRSFNISGYNGLGSQASYFDSDSTFLITGYASRYIGTNTTSKLDMLLAKFDTNFNLLWSTILVDNRPVSVSQGAYGKNIIVDKNEKILVTGYENFHSNLRVGYAASFDAKTGASLWIREYSSDFGIIGMYCATRDDGSYQFIQNRLSDSAGSDFHTNIGIMDSLGNILVEKLIGNHKRRAIFIGLIPTLDDNYYAAGYGSQGHHVGIGLKFSSKLDSLWQGHFWHDDPDIKEIHTIRAFSEKPNGNLFHYGSHDHRINSPIQQGHYPWLYETDKNGCNKAGCNLGFDDFKAANTLEFSIYPNPNQGAFHIKFQNEPNKGCYQLEIWDMLGRKVRNETSLIDDNCLLGDIRLPSGVYQAIILKDGIRLGNEKLVIE